MKYFAKDHTRVRRPGFWLESTQFGILVLFRMDQEKMRHKAIPILIFLSTFLTSAYAQAQIEKKLLDSLAAA